MTIVMTCQHCNAQMRLEDQYAGKKIRCPKCQEVLTAPSNRSAQASPRSSRQSQPVSKPKATASKSEASQDHEYEYQYDYPSPGEGARRTSRGASDSRRSAPSSGGLSQGLLIGLGAGGLLLACGGCVIAWWLVMRPGSSDDSLSGNLAANQPATSSPAAPVVGGPGTGGSIAQSGTGIPGGTSPAVPDPQNSIASSGNGSSSVARPDVSNPGRPGLNGAPGTATYGKVEPGTSPPGTLPPGSLPPGVGLPTTPPPGVPSGIPADSTASSSPATPTTPSSSPATPASGTPSAGTPTPTPVAGMLAASESELSLSDLFARVKPAVVRVNVAASGGTSQGSGFVVDPSGIVVTNYHVISGGNRAWIEFFDNERVEIDGVLYLNHQKDLALLKIDPAKTKRQLVGIPVAKQLPAQGVTVAAIGAPLGLDMSISEGIVSAVRTADELKSAIGLSGHDGTWVQTTAAISPGNSGGPLLNRFGEVLAINTMTFAAPGAQSLNFGISCADIQQGVTEQKGTAVALSPLLAPERDMRNNIDPTAQDDLIDVSGTEEGKRLLAEVRKVQVAIVASSAADPNRVVTGAVREELNNVMKRLKIEESLISNDVSVLFVAIRLDPSGDKRSVFITAHIFTEDKSTGLPRALKLWERTGNAGTVTVQSLLTGRLSTNFNNDLRGFFGKLREDVQNARKALEPPK
ncbi:MAG: trypsin-like peptidase domain-containing protein [Planctomyces sp.]|nr:trypsin-like peptidase domain-containing protein [Planctomyces sp.]